VNLKKRQIRVERNEWLGHVTSTKGNRVRYVPMTMHLAIALQRYRHPRGLCALPRERPNTCRACADRSACKGRSPGERAEQGAAHSAHTFCSHLAMRGAPARAIQELAGHRDLMTTQKYMHLSPSAVADAIRRLDGSAPRGDISNDVGDIKTHNHRSGRRSRLSKAKSRRRRPCLRRSAFPDVHTSTLEFSQHQ
jgi:site-specific recombinase XerC